MNIILFLIKNWKLGGVILLAAAFLISVHLAQDRGKRLEVTKQSLNAERKNFEAQIRKIEKVRQNEKKRNDFRKKQNSKIKLADDAGLHDAYERLRERQSSRITE